MIRNARFIAASLEVITIDNLICEVCGTANPPGTEFCTNCNNYLAWDRSGTTKPAKTTEPPTSEDPSGADRNDGSGPSGPTPRPAVPTDVSCPTCGTTNPDTRRFCTHCGYAFFYGEADPYAGYNMSPGSQAAQDRAARKAYRRSLPPLYRWRRVIIGVVMVALVTSAAVVLLRSDPIGTVQSGWYSLRREFVWVRPVTASVVPADATATKSS